MDFTHTLEYCRLSPHGAPRSVIVKTIEGKYQEAIAKVKANNDLRQAQIIRAINRIKTLKEQTHGNHESLIRHR
ncbi:MAG: hypothetical protein J7647_22290 [Cyanobacteria bacterium SBLK]|nr:hypothetical protein [Cyanobacteria bacterium SBLK]